MDHATHEAGTIPECPACVEAAYEPGWYALLRRLSERPEEEQGLLLVASGGGTAPVSF